MIGRSFSTLFVAALVLSLLPFKGAMADALNFFLDDTFSNISTTTRESGQTTKSDSVSYEQRYTLLVDKSIFPNLIFDGTGMFEKDFTTQKQTGQEPVTATSDKFLPSATLTLKQPLYTVAVGYFLNEQEETASRTPNVTLTNRDLQALLDWRPAGLPYVNFRYDHIDTQDLSASTANLDTVSDNYQLISHYAFKGFDLRYFGTYVDTQDKVHDVDTIDLTQNGTAAYNNSFIGGRLLFGTSYNIIRNDLTTTAVGSGGTASVQIFPYSGLFAVSNTPALGALSPNAALIDGNLTASTGINLGLPPLGGNLQPLNIGLDFLNPTQVNDLQVWIDRTITTDVANSFSWSIYTSNDNLTWTLLQTVFPATFGPFQNRFDIEFTSVKTRYIKVVVAPLAATVNGASSFPNIFVTELQAFVTQSLEQSREQRISSTSEVSNTTARYSIFSNNLLSYESSYFYSNNSSSGLKTSTLSNGLSSNYRFTSFLTGSGRFAYETGEEQNQKETAYLMDASLIATPLPTLTNSLVFSERDETLGGMTQDSQSIFLNNVAQLYKGLDANFNLGRLTSTETTGLKLQSDNVTVGANIVPNRKMTWTFAFTYIDTNQAGPAVPSVSGVSRQETATLAYTPVSTMYLFASVQSLNQPRGPNRLLQNYGFNWSPFPDGALQFRFAYNENVIPGEQSSDVISPGLRYKINNVSYIDVSYQSVESKSPGLITKSKGVAAELRVSVF